VYSALYISELLLSAYCLVHWVGDVTNLPVCLRAATKCLEAMFLTQSSHYTNVRSSRHLPAFCGPSINPQSTDPFLGSFQRPRF